jgi:putative oxygen-independent coproporphyrinogen III oxidase
VFFRELPPLSLYIHIPWCIRKCPYCDFNSHEVRGELPEQAYVAALLRDLDDELPRVEGRPVISIFIGGGTPSLFSGEAIAILLEGVRRRLPLVSEAEITLESNPGTVMATHLQEYHAAGINRLSIGVQSFRDPQLQSIGRIHGQEEALAAYQAARAAGFDSINLDLMFGLPEDDLNGAMKDLTVALALGPDHLSWYQLTIEPNTAFYRWPPSLPDDEELLTIQQQGQLLLAAQGYAQYEISAYARAGKRCRHNLNYWEFGDYLGIGAGAHGKITDHRRSSITRSAKRNNPKEYIKTAGSAAALSDQHVLEAGQVVVEFMMNALRLKEGFSPSLFTSRTGLPYAILEPTLNEAAKRGFIEHQEDRIRPTELGYQYLNELIYLFYQDEGQFTETTPA